MPRTNTEATTAATPTRKIWHLNELYQLLQEITDFGGIETAGKYHDFLKKKGVLGDNSTPDNWTIMQKDDGTIPYETLKEGIARAMAMRRIKK